VAGLSFSGLAILLTGSRGGTLAAAIALLLALYLCSRQQEGRAMIGRFLRAVFLIGAGVVLLFGAGRALFPSAGQAPQLRARLAPVFGVIDRLVNIQNRGSGRLDIWTGGYRACLAHCLWGAGFGNFEEAYTESFAFSAASTNVGLDRPAHNIYLGLAVETGVIGLTLFGLALVWEWSQLSLQPLQWISPAMRAALFGILVAEIFLSAIWFKYFWLVFVFVRIADGVAANQAVPLAGYAPVRSMAR
jgi:O-antigen ligase